MSFALSPPVTGFRKRSAALRMSDFQARCRTNKHNCLSVALLPRSVGMEIDMAQAEHSKAAEHHETAAKSHRTAAEHHGKGDHTAAHEHSTKAHSSSEAAHKASADAHGKSKTAAKK